MIGEGVSVSELGPLGDFIGSIAVLVTLIVLVLQVRKARLELSAQMTRDIERDNDVALNPSTR